jgi:cytoskeletal protein RodZ
MTDNDDKQLQRLGDYLRGQRQAAGLTEEEFCQKTRISLAMLKAMESGDYQALPAHAFARGFYMLYAKVLELNCERIIDWYSQERQWASVAGDDNSIGGAAINAAPETHRMASAGHARPLTTLLILLAVLAFIITILCWRFEINPVMAIREKIHLVQTRSMSRPYNFRVLSTSKVNHRSDRIDGKRKAPLVTLNGQH